MNACKPSSLPFDVYLCCAIQAHYSRDELSRSSRSRKALGRAGFGMLRSDLLKFRFNVALFKILLEHADHPLYWAGFTLTGEPGVARVDEDAAELATQETEPLAAATTPSLPQGWSARQPQPFGVLESASVLPHYYRIPFGNF